jgi:hypothetical protein
MAASFYPNFYMPTLQETPHQKISGCFNERFVENIFGSVLFTTEERDDLRFVTACTEAPKFKFLL